MWSDLAKPVVIAHRGDSTHAPENTLAAFRMAADKGADAIEFDVKLTTDQKVIAIHDRTVDRTTDGHGQVSQLSFADLRNLDAGMRFDGKFSKERIPSLDEIFEEVGTRLHMNVELTNYATPNDDLVARVVEVTRRHNLAHKVFFSSFLPGNLRKAFSMLPEVPRGLLAGTNWIGWLWRTFLWRSRIYTDLNPHFSNVNVEMVYRLHKANKGVNVWTVNDEAMMKSLLDNRVDGIITDDPQKLLGVLGR